ncbi:MAG: chemotaxis protein CheB [Bacteroidales bacterium]|nr:chemotaxis protein CheB [Bacteroidales bacterium]
MKNKQKEKVYKAIVVGASAGGVEALTTVLPALNADLNFSVVVVQHISPHSDSFLVDYLNQLSPIKVKEVEEKEHIIPGVVYFAPPNYHLLIEEDETFSLTVDDKVNYSRPSIDVLFETAAVAFNQSLIGVILTGANSDGAEGMKRIKQFGGLTVVQDPSSAYVDVMPLAALEAIHADHILKLEEIAPFLNALSDLMKPYSEKNRK